MISLTGFTLGNQNQTLESRTVLPGVKEGRRWKYVK